MGDQRRSDSSRDVKAKGKDDDAHGHEHDGEQFDGAFANKIIEQRTWGDRSVSEPPDGYVRGAGDQNKLETQLDEAIKANDGKDILDIVTKMSRPVRQAQLAKLPRLVQLVGGAEALRLADMLQADLAVTLDAVLGMATPPSAHQMRAYLTDVHPMRLFPFHDAVLRARFSQAYPGSIANVIPQITDDAVFRQYEGLTRWWIETTPAATIARTMLASTKTNVWMRIAALLSIGRPAWEWALAVDENMVVAAGPDIAETFQRQAPDADLQQALADKIAARTAGASAKVAKDLKEHHKEHVAKDSVEQLSTASKAAGASFDEQVTLMLAKPKVTVDEVRLAFAGMSTESGGLTVSGLSKLAAQFPASTPADVFGFVPDQVYRLAIKNKALRPWVVNKAEPIEILRFVTWEPDHIAEICKWLVANKTGYDWVYQLGGGVDDHLIRRFVLECPDLNVADWVKNHIIADAVKPGGHEIGSEKVDPKAYQSNADTLKDDLVRPTAEGKDVAADVDALSEADVAALRADAPRLKTMFAKVGAKHAMRVVARVQPKLRDVLNFLPAGSVGLVEWIGTRKDADLIEGFGHHGAVERAKEEKLLPWMGLLELVPQLEKPEVLAQVLLRNPGLIEWVMKSEPIAAMTVLGNPACAGAAVSALEGHTKLVGRVPPGKMLPQPARAGLALLAQLSKGELHEKLQHKLDEKGVDRDDKDPPQKELNVDVLKGAETSTLVDSLKLAFENKPSDEVVLRICRAHSDEAVSLLRDEKLLEQVQSLVPLSPHLVFPGTPYAALLAVPAGATWLFKTAPAHELLHAAMAEPATLNAIVKALNVGSRAGEAWCFALPRGKALKAAEKTTLHQLTKGLTNIDAHMALFGARYDFEVSGSMKPETLERVWTLLERVPESHISDGIVKQMQFFDAKTAPNVAGEYRETTMLVQEGMMDRGGQQTGDRSGGPDAKVLMTKQEAMENLGLDEKTFQQWVADKRLMQDANSGLFRIGYHDETDVLTSTMLHELGHGIHHMIGNKSELIFDLVGWKAYTEADFDGWASELGGWSGVKPEDQKEIRDVWMMWLSSSHGDSARESVGDMVRSDHPAVSKTYAGVGIVDFARKKSMVSRLDPAMFGDRAAFVSHKQQRWYTIGKRGLLSAPSDYALTAPGEYFAECYMQYYRDYDGKDPATKGGRLAPWIKEWFDNNIDNTTHNPRAGDDFSGDA